MICEFSFSNFRSFKNEAVLDFSARPIKEIEDSLINADKMLFLPVCVIYGPNGGGKSSVLMALKTLQEIIIEPLLQMGFMKNKNEKLASYPVEKLRKEISREGCSEMYYKWDRRSRNDAVVFRILFVAKDKKYCYEVTFKDQCIIEENLYTKNTCMEEIRVIFERDYEGVYLCEDLRNMDVDKLNANLPLISYIAMFKDFEAVDDAIRFFMNMQVLGFDRPEQNWDILARVIEKNKKKFLNVISSMGIDIADVRMEYNSDGKITEVYTKYYGTDNELRMKEESSGIRKILNVLPVILEGMRAGTLFIVDELDAKLHPALLQSMISLFTDPVINAAGAQMLFTSHDLITMNSKVFRRDEIWFSAINGYNESVLYSLADFEEEDETIGSVINYSKQYLEGRYGADPYMKKIKNWEVLSCP